MKFRELLEDKQAWLRRDMNKLEREQTSLHKRGKVLNNMIDSSKYNTAQKTKFKEERNELVNRLDMIKNEMEYIEIKQAELKIGIQK